MPRTRREPAPAPSIVDALDQDHQRIEAMFAELDRGRGNRRALFARVAMEVEAHTVAEQRAFYEPLRAGDDSPIPVAHAEQEHRVATRLGREAAALTSGGTLFEAKAKLFVELVRRHIEEEREELFPMARERFDRDEASRLGADFLRRKREAMAALRRKQADREGPETRAP